jgi:hypothetical protein
LESAATPGVVRVTIELTWDEALSNGTVLIKFLSTSVWKVDSFSTRSPPVDSTVTAVTADPTFKSTGTFTGTDERTSMSCVNVANPVAVTVAWYGLKGTFVNLKDPSVPVVTVFE